MEGYLNISHTRVRYGENEILKGIDLSVRKGEFVALLGSSGCGKTTLLRTVAGFNTPTEGTISIGGRDVTRQPPDKRGMALVFQSYALWPHMTVDQNIGYGLKLRRVEREAARQRIDEMKALLGLQALGHRKPAELSGGQRQRVALGRALAINPDILLLDEPLSNLDARIRLTVRHEISALQRRLGITAVHVTHDREEAMVMADRIVIMNGGEIAQAGTPQEVYNQPNSDFVAAFMGAENIVEIDIEVSGSSIGISEGRNNRKAVIDRGDRPLVSGPAIARFRSETVRMTAAADAASGAHRDGLVLTGQVAQVSYPGGLWRHVVHLGDTSLIVDAAARFEEGASVDITVPDTALYIFPRP
ncbi:ABC-type Fe3+/spermidine/putrescine transport system ATPase subunit [Neorhizobium galegae]|uniref:ABC transporter ATP-binding protein n=1 Tax=Neorhizobium galegae TaxID=399 RepID=UPI001AE31C11|nr:ABC transporter ATP-binding protein [Neorhizobium galegae]MBP2548589.1 ABC-type Fe3+/spermidine/putrescine transport system ATPase subunit [Neorhizobium galegae]